MIRPKLFLAMTFCATATIGGAWNAGAAPKPAAAPAAKGGWSATEAPVASFDPAYAAYDSGNYGQALKLATDAAAKGEVQADTLIGKLYSEGLGIRQDEAKAAEWFTKGAVAGDMHAQFELGLMLAQGRGVKKDEKKSADFFEAAAQQGHTLAAYNLAQTYVQGWARPQDMQKAAYWLEQAAKKDHHQAAYDLATLYRSGEGIPGMMRRPPHGWQRQHSAATPTLKSSTPSCWPTAREFRRTKRAPWRCCAWPPNAAMPSLKTVWPAPFPPVPGLPADRIQAAKWHIFRPRRRRVPI